LNEKYGHLNLETKEKESPNIETIEDSNETKEIQSYKLELA